MECGGPAQHLLSLCHPGSATHLPGEFTALSPLCWSPCHRAAERERGRLDGAQRAGGHDLTAWQTESET